jgi:sulfide:quinone oxidoreductase
VSGTDMSVQPFRVLIAGGGVAALEAAPALRELAGERVSTALLAPEPEFIYRPMTVREPFAYRVAERYPIDEIARDIGVELLTDSLKSLDASGRLVLTEAGEQLGYDALLLASARALGRVTATRRRGHRRAHPSSWSCGRMRNDR